jgi:hypothetical protein
MDSWLQRLVVRGLTVDVKAFAKAAAGPGSPAYLTTRVRFRTQKLSFARLLASLPPGLARSIRGELQEPWDLDMDLLHRCRDGSAKLTYYFQLNSFECEDLFVAISKVHARLCFVLGMVAPAGDEQSSLLAHNGKGWLWRMPRKQTESIYAKAANDADGAEGNEDDDLSAFWEADGRAMDVVVNHWNKKVNQLTAAIRSTDTRSRPKKTRAPKV